MIYLVMGHRSDWEDNSSWPVYYFLDRKNAERYAEMCQAHLCDLLGEWRRLDQEANLVPGFYLLSLILRNWPMTRC